MPVRLSLTARPLDQRGIFREALLVSGSNPKTLIFLSAFMPQFTTHDQPLPAQFIDRLLNRYRIAVLA